MLKKTLTILFVFVLTAFAQPKEPMKGEKCPVCGMFVTSKDKMLYQIKLKDGSYKFAEGPKHIFKFYFYKL